MEKLYVQYADVHNLVSLIARSIQADSWEPDVIVAIASGGFIPARIFKTFLKKDIYVVALRRYHDENGVVDPIPVKLQWIDEVEKKLAGKKILLVDEVDDTRVTLAYCIGELFKHRPAEVRAAVLHQKLKAKGAEYPAELTKVYEGCRVADTWIKYPWDARDIAAHERGED